MPYLFLVVRTLSISSLLRYQGLFNPKSRKYFFFVYIEEALFKLVMGIMKYLTVPCFPYTVHTRFAVCSESNVQAESTSIWII
jgi:hypothetical protein